MADEKHFTWCLMGMVYFTQVACCSVSSSSSFFSRLFTFSFSSRSMEVMRCSLKQESTVYIPEVRCTASIKIGMLLEKSTSLKCTPNRLKK